MLFHVTVGRTELITVNFNAQFYIPSLPLHKFLPPIYNPFLISSNRTFQL